jgi:predicted transcriptional regulator
MQNRDFTSLNKDDIARLLKEQRAQSKKSTSDVTSLLKDRGIFISETTLYGYENGVSTPKVKIFLALCDIYGITDIMSALGLSIEKPAGNIADGLSKNESIMLNLFRMVPEEDHDMVVQMVEAALRSRGLL